MGLINLRTNLKSLRFGNDTQGGGASGLPYIQTGLPEDSPAGEYLASIARNSVDWPLRGGQYWTIASTEDTVRVSRFLTDFPKGTTFTTKQVQLQKSNPRIETGGFASRLNTQTYNLNGNLLAQVLEQGSGIHIPRAGANTNELGPDNPQAKYEWIVSHKDTDQNRLVTLYNVKVNPPTGISLGSLISNADKLGISSDNDNILFDYVGGPDSLYGDGNTTIFKATDFQGVSINTNETFSTFEKGPFANISYDPNFSFFSKTDFENVDKRYSSLTRYILTTNVSSSLSQNFKSLLGAGNRNTLNQQGNNKLTSGEYIRPETKPSDNDKYVEGQPNYFGNTMAYSKLLSSKINSGINYELQDFRIASIDTNTLALDYTSPEVRIETRLQLGDPGTRTRDQRKYINQINGGVGQDKINLLPLYQSSGDPIQTNSVRDMIKFCIEVINNDDLNTTVPLHFRAYITDFSDNIGAEWNAQKYMGRGENFYTYQGFTREVSFKLTVAAQSKQEMMPLYQKLNYLASSLMPDYNSNGFMRGNLHKLTVGEWFYRTPGVLKSMNVSIDNNYPWEIKFTEPETRTFGADDFQKSKDVVPSQHSTKNNKAKGSENFQNSNSDTDMMELPQILSINFTFSPILNNLPRLAKEGGLFTQSPILISDHGDNENFIKRIVN